MTEGKRDLTAITIQEEKEEDVEEQSDVASLEEQDPEGLEFDPIHDTWNKGDGGQEDSWVWEVGEEPEQKPARNTVGAALREIVGLPFLLLQGAVLVSHPLVAPVLHVLSMPFKQELNMVRTLILIVILFILCQSVKLIADIYEVYSCATGSSKPPECWLDPPVLVNYSWMLAHLLLSVNSSANFFVYVASGTKFRKALVDLLTSRRNNYGARRNFRDQNKASYSLRKLTLMAHITSRFHMERNGSEEASRRDTPLRENLTTTSIWRSQSEDEDAIKSFENHKMYMSVEILEEPVNKNQFGSSKDRLNRYYLRSTRV